MTLSTTVKRDSAKLDISNYFNAVNQLPSCKYVKYAVEESSAIANGG